MTQMKSEALPRTGIVDAIGTGLSEAARRPYLWIVPIVVDLVLWLAPRLSVTALAEHVMDWWRNLLPMVYSTQQMAAAREGIDLIQSTMVEAAKSVNLSSVLTVGWLAPPSALAPIQASRYLMISDAVLAPALLGMEVKPLGAAPWQTGSIEIGSAWSVVLVVAVLWLVAQFIAALYFRQVAVGLQNRPIGASPAKAARTTEAHPDADPLVGWLPLAVRFAVVSLFASLAAFMLRLPLLLVTTLAVFAGSGAASFLFVVGGGITLWLTMWFLSALFFVAG